EPEAPTIPTNSPLRIEMVTSRRTLSPDVASPWTLPTPSRRTISSFIRAGSSRRARHRGHARRRRRAFRSGRRLHAGGRRIGSALFARIVEQHGLAFLQALAHRAVVVVVLPDLQRPLLEGPAAFHEAELLLLLREHGV